MQFVIFCCWNSEIVFFLFVIIDNVTNDVSWGFKELTLKKNLGGGVENQRVYWTVRWLRQGNYICSRYTIILEPVDVPISSRQFNYVQPKLWLWRVIFIYLFLPSHKWLKWLIEQLFYMSVHVSYISGTQCPVYSYPPYHGLKTQLVMTHCHHK